MRNQITKEQLTELVKLRLNTIGQESFEGDISDLKDPILNWYITLSKRINSKMVKCDHCGEEVHIDNAVACEWEDYNMKWFYCERCNKGFKVNNK